MTKRELAEAIAEFLSNEGFRPTIDEDCEVRFSFMDSDYWVQPHEDDPCYFRLIAPIREFEASEAGRNRAARAASDASATVKSAKAFVVGADPPYVYCVADGFYDTPSGFQCVFDRALYAIQAATGVIDDALGEAE